MRTLHKAATPDELYLLGRVARAEDDAIEQMYRSYADDLLRFVYRRVDVIEDAQEITQDTFLHAVRLAGTYRGESSAFVWLCGIARLRIADHIRKRFSLKRKAQETAVSLEEANAVDCRDAERLIDVVEAAKMVEDLMDVLSEDEREAVRLRYVEELSLREISILTKRSERGVESLLTRALRRQRNAAEAWFDRGVDQEDQGL